MRPSLGRRAQIEILESRTLLSTIVVNSTSDMPMPPVPMVTLRKAIALADAATTATTITFSSSVFSTHKTITLSKFGLDLTNTHHATTITGPSVGVTVSEASTIFNINAHVQAAISNVTVDGIGHGLSDGIDNDGTLTLINDTVTQNSTTGISNGGTVTLTNVTISDNGHKGVSDTFGGFFNAKGGTATLTNCTISGNQEHFGGQAISYGLIDGGGGFNNLGTATLIDTTLSGNSAGGQDEGGSADDGGGFCNTSGSAVLINTTISANTARYGGGIAIVSGSVTLNDCTISKNNADDGGGIGGDKKMTLANTIVAGNSGDADQDASGHITSLGHNLIGIKDGSSGWISTDLTGTSTHPLNAGLGALANNGGPTKTMLPQAGSPAINAGSNALIPANISLDQRGLPRISGGTVDIGAIEVQQLTVVAGTVFFDANKTGKQDSGDSALAGWEVYDDIGNKGHFVSGDPFTFTSSTGAYKLSVPFSGEAILRQIAPANFTQTTPTSNAAYHVTITADSAKQQFGFGDFTSVKYLETVATTSGIVAWWTFDSPTPTEPPPDPDSILNGYTSTLEGGAKLTAAGKGAPINGESNSTGLSLNGTSAFLKTNLTTQQQFPSAGTFNVWINLIPAVQHTETILSKSQTNNALELAIDTDGSVHFLTDHTTTASFKPASLSGWHMVTAEFDTSAKLEKIFWDGKQVASVAPGSQSPSTAALEIGASDVAGGRFFGGTIDEVSLFDRALSSSEIANIFNAASGK